MHLHKIQTYSIWFAYIRLCTVKAIISISVIELNSLIESSQIKGQIWFTYQSTHLKLTNHICQKLLLLHWILYHIFVSESNLRGSSLLCLACQTGALVFESRVTFLPELERETIFFLAIGRNRNLTPLNAITLRSHSNLKHHKMLLIVFICI